MDNPRLDEIHHLRRALSRLAQALPEAEARLVAATVRWTPETAQAYEALHADVVRMRSELERIAAELEARLERSQPDDPA